MTWKKIDPENLPKRACYNCKFASEQYKLTNNGYYPPTSIYIQCAFPISELLRSMLPTSFYRESATRIGYVDPENGGDVLLDIGEDCPEWEGMSTIAAAKHIGGNALNYSDNEGGLIFDFP